MLTGEKLYTHQTRPTQKNLSHVQLIVTDKPAKVVKSVVTKEQFDQLVAQMNDVQNENRQIKQFVRHQLPSLQNRQKYNSD